jgi:hypothetical protein
MLIKKLKLRVNVKMNPYSINRTSVILNKNHVLYESWYEYLASKQDSIYSQRS